MTISRQTSPLFRFPTLAVFWGAVMLGGIVAGNTQQIPETVTIRNFFQWGNDSLTFNRPVAVRPYPDEDSAFVVLEQGGRILTVRWLDQAWTRTDTATLAVLGGSNGIDEQGLLGFAFHPEFVTNRKYYVYFVGGSMNARVDVVAERTAGASGRPATSDAHRTVLRVNDPYDNHNAGTLGFDAEGHLVLAIGDGGTTQGDPQNRAQNTDSLLGKFLRLDVDAPDAYPQDTTRNYAIPATNPFLDSAGYRPEIWAYGLRNPWKWSFHPVTGEIWVGDVGQNDREEVSRVPKGANLGWRLKEADICFKPATGCEQPGLQDPALAIPRSQASSITGGVFFMAENPAVAFHGTYVFGDYGTHRVWAARLQDTVLTDLTQIGSINKVVSFDRDRQGRILATSISPTTGFSINSNIGRVLALESPDMGLPPPSPTSLRTARPRSGIAPVRAADVRRRPDAYVLRGIDGRARAGLSRGITIVTEKSPEGAGAARRAIMATVD